MNKEECKLRLLINTSSSNLALEGSYADVLKQLQEQIRVNQRTTMVSIDVTSLEKEHSDFFSQDISKKSNLNTLVRFSSPVDEIQAIIGVMQTELAFLGM